jgi:hypothetical protein
LSVLAVLVAPAMALAQHNHGGAAPMGSGPASAGGSTSSPSAGSNPSRPSGAVLTSLPPDALDEMQGLHVGVGLDHSLGQGTFVDTRYYASLVGALEANVGYSFKVKDLKLNASASESISWEYTLPDNETGKRFNYSDLRVGISAPGIYKESNSGIGLTVNFGASVPLSPESRLATTITNLSLGFAFSRTLFDVLDLSYRIGGGRHLHVNNQMMTPADTSRDALGNLIFVCRTDEAYCGSMGNNSAWSLSHSVSVGYRPTERLSFSLGFNLSSGWKEAGDIGGTQYNSQALDSNGNPVVKNGMVVSNRMSGSVGASYSLTDNMALSLSMANAGPTLTKDGKNVRFPFYDFLSTADSLTQFSLSLSAQF